MQNHKQQIITITNHTAFFHASSSLNPCRCSFSFYFSHHRLKEYKEVLHCLSGKENQLIQVIARHKNLIVQAITRIRIKPFWFAKPQAAGWDYNYYESHCFLLRQKQLKSLQMQFSFFFSVTTGLKNVRKCYIVGVGKKISWFRF